jgi:hypothetical protein
MHPQETPNEPQTEGQIIPPEEQIIPSGGGTMPPPEVGPGGDQSESEATPEPMAAAGQAQSLARSNPMPIGLAVAFVAGVVVGRIASRR